MPKVRMRQQLADFINENELLSPHDRMLLAVSGGVDSVVMAHLFHALGYKFSVAHVNFQLRGHDSDEDQVFVNELANELGADYHTIKFGTLGYANAKGISEEMAARDLRYQWFEELLQKHQYNWVATAHHQNDVLETMLLNFTKGTGIRGLHGIKAKRGHVIRPLLFATKELIQEYAQENQLAWRLDRSNQQDNYQRNLIRNQVVPILKRINPKIEAATNTTAEILRDIEKLLNDHVGAIKGRLCTQQGPDVLLNIHDLKDQPLSVRYEILQEYGFNIQQIRGISKTISAQSGKVFLSKSFKLNIDRTQIIISPCQESKDANLKIYEPNPGSWQQLKNGWNLNTRSQDGYVIVPDAEVAALDSDKLQFPLQVRIWQPGDWFYPLGMSQHKKVSNFLIDEKVPLNTKDQIQVIVSGTDIIWLVGYRIDNRFKITPDTKRILEISVNA